MYSSPGHENPGKAARGDRGIFVCSMKSFMKPAGLKTELLSVLVMAAFIGSHAQTDQHCGIVIGFATNVRCSNQFECS